jgi:sortase (surface protein transpeptidase)
VAGHVENYAGEPGPFAHLFEAQMGDLIFLADGTREQRYRVTAIEYVGLTISAIWRRMAGIM